MTSGTSYTELVEKGREEGGQYMEREESSFSIRRIQDLEGKAKGQFGGKARPVSPLRPPKAKSQPAPDPGVIDLGASQTVIGDRQVPELLQALPTTVRSKMKLPTVFSF